MKTGKQISVLLLLLTSTTLFAQNYKPGKVSEKELEEKACPYDIDATAAVLYEKGEISFDFNSQGKWIIVTDVFVRLKVYSKDGYGYANEGVSYYVDGVNSESVDFSDLVVYNLLDGKVDKTKIKDDDVFDEEINKKWRVKKVAFPNVKEGSVIEFRYVKKTPYIASLPDWYFQRDIPVKKSEVEFGVPQCFVYSRILSPYFPLEQDKKTRNAYREYSTSVGKGVYGTSSGSNKSEKASLTFTENVYIYKAENVPALKNEVFVDNINNYRSFVKHQLSSSQMPGEAEKKYASDWDTVASKIYEDEDFGKQIENQSYYREDVDALLQGVTNDEKKIEIIFDYVKNKMAWNGDKSYLCTGNLKRAYDNRTGNSADINLMLVSMLKYARVNANPILLSTRDNGHVAFVNRSEFNYVIAGAQLPGKVVLLDATSKNAGIDVVPVRTLNVFGRMITDDLKAKEISLMPEKKSRTNVMLIASLDAEGQIDGDMKKQYFDYEALLYREEKGNSSEDDKIRGLENRYGIRVEEYKALNVNEVSKAVVEEVSFTSDVDVAGDKMYFSPMLMLGMTQNPFKQEERVYPIDVLYPRQERYAITINIPDGYKVESLPESIALGTQDDFVSYKFVVAVNQNNQIQIIAQEDVKYARINPEYYRDFKAFYGDLVKKQTEKIVLVKE
ncbi:DUF3857 domain-containing protein [Flavobacterium sp. C4GT6]|uniref:DUF3857 domain-containing protein n=1 Tax=Flavobacterium sp. C4GT6 TaxID=3103818 RepID=UPI002ED2B494